MKFNGNIKMIWWILNMLCMPKWLNKFTSCFSGPVSKYEQYIIDLIISRHVLETEKNNLINSNFSPWSKNNQWACIGHCCKYEPTLI